jgi:hypothetical protein
MRRESQLVVGLAFSLSCFAAAAWAQPDRQLPEPIVNWSAPPYFRLPAGADEAVNAAGRGLGAAEALGGALPITPPLPFVGLFPCRVADTRSGQGFSGQAGPPTILANTVRTFRIADPVPGAPNACGVPSTARAVSFQFTVTSMTSNGNLIAWPEGTAPAASVLNWNANSVAIGNGIVVPISATGNLNVQINAPLGQAANLIIDVNGYYATQSNAAPADFLTFHASFQGTGLSGTNATQIPGDGALTLQTDPTANAFIDVIPHGINGMTHGLQRTGTYVSARARWNSFPIGGTHVFWVLGGGSSGGTALQNGFGFKAVGAALKGVSIANGVETIADLATTLTTGNFRDLLAVRTDAAIEFFVDGVLKGSVGVTLPTVSSSSYEVRLTNGTGGGVANFDVGLLTVGIPMF